MSYRDDIIGKTFDSNNYGKFTVLRRMKRVFKPANRRSNNAYYEVQFENTGGTTYTSRESIRKGQVRDHYCPIASGLGYLGDMPYGSHAEDADHYEYYKVWLDMLRRCYNPNYWFFKGYGGLGITVDPRWYDFSVFYNDAKYTLPNYEKKLAYPKRFQLDKDYLQRDVPKPKRIYSINTCMWLSDIDNTFMMGIDKNPYGYCGVKLSAGGYLARYHDIGVGKFTTPEATANLINYVHLAVNDPYFITVLNDVEPIPFDELENYSMGRRNYRERFYELVQRLSCGRE